eukprot:561408-Prymnesium_polylepis.1
MTKWKGKPAEEIKAQLERLTKMQGGSMKPELKNPRCARLAACGWPDCGEGGETEGDHMKRGPLSVPQGRAAAAEIQIPFLSALSRTSTGRVAS